MYKHIVIITFLLVNHRMFPQVDPVENCTYRLEGRVLDEHDQSALEYASVLIIDLNLSTVSDDKGYYRFDNLCEGEYRVRVYHLSCEPIDDKVTIRRNTRKNFYPEHHTELLKDVAVIAQKEPVQPSQPTDELSGEKLFMTRGQNLGDALRNITGVTTLNTGNTISKPVIHGMHSNRVLIMNNGIRQEGQQWGAEHAPEVDPYTADRIKVVKGANSLRYGSDAIAGVILTEQKPLRDSAGLNGEINLTGMSNGRSSATSAFVEGNFRNLPAFSWRLQSTLKRAGDLNAPDYILSNTGLREYNFSYALGWKRKNYGAEVYYSQFNTSLGILEASHIGNLTDLRQAFESGTPAVIRPFSYQVGRPYQQIEHELFKFKTHLITGGKGKVSLTYARQYNLRNEFDKHRRQGDSLTEPNPELHFELTSHTADLIFERNFLRRLNGIAGISGITQGNTYEGRNFIPNFRNESAGIFLIGRWAHSKVEIEGGIRYDRRHLQVYKYELINSSWVIVSPEHNFSNTCGNAGIIYRADTNLRFRLNLGSAWRAPAINELYSNGLHHGAASLEFGDKGLKSERTYNAILSAEYRPSELLSIELSPYLHYICGFIYRQPGTNPILTIQGTFPSFYYRQADARLHGLDISLRSRFHGRLELGMKASILRAWNISEKNWLILMPSERYDGELIYRFRQRRNIKSWYLSADFTYVTKQWRVPAGTDFAAPPPAWHVIGIKAVAQIRIKNQIVETGFSVNNLLNYAYRDYLDRFRYFADAMGRNYTLRIKIPFNLSPEKTKHSIK